MGDIRSEFGLGRCGKSGVKMTSNWNPTGKEARSQRGHSKRRVSDRGKVTIGEQEKMPSLPADLGHSEKRRKGGRGQQRQVTIGMQEQDGERP